jgi:hypothetical protein
VETDEPGTGTILGTPAIHDSQDIDFDLLPVRPKPVLEHLLDDSLPVLHIFL